MISQKSSDISKRKFPVPANRIVGVFSSVKCLKTKFPKGLSLFLLEEQNSSCFLFCVIVGNGIPRVCFYFCSMVQNSEHFSLSRTGSGQNSECFLFSWNSFRTNHLFRLFRLLRNFLSEIPNPRKI